MCKTFTQFAPTTLSTAKVKEACSCSTCQAWVLQSSRREWRKGNEKNHPKREMRKNNFPGVLIITVYFPGMEICFDFEHVSNIN
jgi:hypothetical protein